MPRRPAVILATLALLAVGLGAAPAVLAGDPCYHGFDVPLRSDGSATQIKALPCAFAPTITRVPVGSTVEFFSGPDFVHLVTGANAEWGSRDVQLQPNSKVSYRFNKAGIFPYACALHRGMSGAIVVGDLSAPAAAAPVASAAPSAAAAAPVAASDQAPASSRAAATDLRPIVGLAVVGAAVLALGFVFGRRRTLAA